MPPPSTPPCDLIALNITSFQSSPVNIYGKKLLAGHRRPAWMDNVKTWTLLTVEESIRMAEDRDKWRKYVHGVANHRGTEDG